MFSKSQLTSYAHDYLSGYNNVPIGALDDAFFQSECSRLSGYTPPTPAQEAAQAARVARAVKKIQKLQAALLGPKGGKPKSGEALREYKNLEYNLRILGVA